MTAAILFSNHNVRIALRNSPYTDREERTIKHFDILLDNSISYTDSMNNGEIIADAMRLLRDRHYNDNLPNDNDDASVAMYDEIIRLQFFMFQEKFGSIMNYHRLLS